MPTFQEHAVHSYVNSSDYELCVIRVIDLDAIEPKEAVIEIEQMNCGQWQYCDEEFWLQALFSAKFTCTLSFYKYR